MKCKFCGHSLSLNQSTCPNCGMLMDNEQLKRKKELNGENSPYMQKLNELNKNKYKLEKNEDPKTIKQMLVIIAILLFIILLGIICLSRG